MDARRRLLILDDDPDFLEIYQDILGDLPSKPEIHTATSGARAIALLESQPFAVLLCDLNMPKMDGLQVLGIVRRRFPDLRTAVMTALVDDQFRMRAYAIGVDVFLEKPSTPDETKFFLDCLETLLNREQASTGFRGVQSKTLVDILQLEGLSQSSSVLRITHGVNEGKIWFLNGDIVDAITLDLTGESAFYKILSWKTGSFEILPAEPDRPRTIQHSFQSLLLETAHAMDEVKDQETEAATAPEHAAAITAAERMAGLSRYEGLEFVLAASVEDKQRIESWGTENQQQVANWTRETLRQFRALGERLQVGQLRQVVGQRAQGHVILISTASLDLCLGFQSGVSVEKINEATQRILAQWDS